MRIVRKIAAKLPMVVSLVILALCPVVAAVAQDAHAAAGGWGPLGAGLAIGLAVIGGALGQGKVVSAMLESFGRNPSVGGKLLTPMMIGMVLIESLVILAFVIAFRL